MKTISVIVPIYNVEPYLKKCLDSLLKQTYPQLEIILVNDGSPDGCGQICEEYAKKDTRIKVIHKTNGGLSDARNAGLQIATGQYIGFIDSDDYIDEDMYEYLLKGLELSKADIAICGTKIDFEDGNTIVKSNNKKEILNAKEAIIKLNSFSSFDMAVWNKLYKKEIIQGIEFPVGKKSEDYYVMYQYFHRANKVVVLEEAKYHYFQRNNSISRGKQVSEDYIEGSRQQKEFIQTTYPDIAFVGNTAYAFAYMATYNRYIKNQLKMDKQKKKEYKQKVKKYCKDIQNNPYIAKKKKIQAMVFSKSITLYTILFKKINHV